MKRNYLIELISTYVILFLLLIMSIESRCQTQYRIDSVMKIKEQTAFCRAREMKTGNIIYFSLNFRGAGKHRDLIGKWVTYYAEGLPMRRRVHFIINQ